MTNIDIHHDPGHARLARILTDMPALACYLGRTKVAAMEGPPEELPDGAFADRANRYFPIHTPKIAALSYAYAKLAGLDGVRVPDMVVDRIKEALDAFSIDEAVFELRTVVEKNASADDCIFPEKQLYPARNAKEVKLAEEALHREKSKLLPENRAAAFARLVEKAAEHGTELSAESYKLAGLTETDTVALRDELRAHGAAAGWEAQPAVKEAFFEIADAVASNKGPLDRSTRVKIAQTVADLDKKAGLQKHYGKKLSEPVEAVFNTTKLVESGVSIDGTVVSFTKLMSLDPSFYGDALGDDFIPDITTGGHLDRSKVAEVLKTLPRDMQKTLKTALKNTGKG